jgi:hypothetical protein
MREDGLASKLIVNQARRSSDIHNHVPWIALREQMVLVTSPVAGTAVMVQGKLDPSGAAVVAEAR